MTEDPKPLRELNVKPGDVVRLYDAATDRSPVWPPRDYTIQPCGGIIDADGYMWGGSSTNFPDYPPYRRFIIVSRADVPKLWRDMTPEEQGAIKNMANWIAHNATGCGIDLWNEVCDAISIRPEPKRETVTQYWKTGKKGKFVPMQIGNGCQPIHNPTHRITFEMIDGKPDMESVKMEEMGTGGNT